MGNQLDRPTLLLKRNFIRDTNFNEEVVQTGQQFQQMREEVADYAMASNYCAPAAMNYAPMMQSIAGAHMDMYGESASRS